MIVSEKLNNEDDEFLIKSIFKSFKGSTIPLHQNVKAPKRNFYHEAVTFDEFRNGMRKLPEFVSEVFFVAFLANNDNFDTDRLRSEKCLKLPILTRMEF